MSIARLGQTLALLAALTMPWDGIIVGGIRPGDALLLLALAVLVLASASERLPAMPGWYWSMVFAVLVVGCLHQLFPTDPAYLAGRLVVDATGRPTSVNTGTNLAGMLRFIVSVGAVPLVMVLATRHGGARMIRLLALAFTSGVAISGYVAMTDRLGITAFETPIPAIYHLPARNAGLTLFANASAEMCVIAIPLALWAYSSALRGGRIFTCVTVPGLVLGLYASGSRGGAGSVVVAIALSVLLLPALRRHTLRAVGIGVGVVVLFFALVPSAGLGLLHSLRLTGSSNAAESDVVRGSVGAQGYHDFAHSPLDGIGLQVVFQAHNVYLQALASGGVILFLALCLLLGGAAWSSWTMRNRFDFGPALAAAIISQVTVVFFENTLPNRYMYVVIGLAIAAASVAAEEDTVAEAGSGPQTVPGLSTHAAGRNAEYLSPIPGRQVSDAIHD